MSFGIICEYNPFHNGHLHQIKTIKKHSDEPIICVMSGNFTQRGEIALLDKYERAKMAILAGADLVLELPVPFCLASAEYFARAGVEILSSVGVDKLSFGSESGNAERITSLAQIAASDEFREECANASRDEGSAFTYFKLLSEKAKALGIDAEILSNDILAIEYTKAILLGGYDIEIHPILREGSAYLDTELNVGEYPSASAIRESIKNNSLASIANFVPDFTIEILKNAELSNVNHIKNGILLSLRMLDEQKIDVAIRDRGLINRILSYAKDSSSYDEFFNRVQTKKYTASAIRRAILYILLGIKHSDLLSTPAYTNVLGMNEVGRELLASLRKSEQKIKIITKPSDASLLQNKEAKNQLSLAEKSDALYTLAFDTKKESSYYFKKNPIIK